MYVPIFIKLGGLRAMAKFACVEPECSGTIDTQKGERVFIHRGCTGGRESFPCPICGRLHLGPGEGTLVGGEDPDNQEKVYLSGERVITKPSGKWIPATVRPILPQSFDRL